ncbi:hypothetical protein DFQ30_007322 [Apophysomyces sp. BC1015]|nr:hypothetical protein DFQ30_007322 [Apophysomyces sp. BC1015]KAG0180243.1 hypothetical protein DFQ29_001020 [Apophysomyces sp. BC1021]
MSNENDPVRSDSEEEEYEVEAILAHRHAKGRGSQIQYLIKWKGYSDEDNTWERESNVSADVLVEQYWADKGGAEGLAEAKNSKKEKSTPKKKRHSLGLSTKKNIVTSPVHKSAQTKDDVQDQVEEIVVDDIVERLTSSEDINIGRPLIESSQSESGQSLKVREQEVQNGMDDLQKPTERGQAISAMENLCNTDSSHASMESPREASVNQGKQVDELQIDVEQQNKSRGMTPEYGANEVCGAAEGVIEEASGAEINNYTVRHESIAVQTITGTQQEEEEAVQPEATNEMKVDEETKVQQEAGVQGDEDFDMTLKHKLNGDEEQTGSENKNIFHDKDQTIIRDDENSMEFVAHELQEDEEKDSIQQEANLVRSYDENLILTDVEATNTSDEVVAMDTEINDAFELTALPEKRAKTEEEDYDNTANKRSKPSEEHQDDHLVSNIEEYELETETLQYLDDIDNMDDQILEASLLSDVKFSATEEQAPIILSEAGGTDDGSKETCLVQSDIQPEAGIECLQKSDDIDTECVIVDPDYPSDETLDWNEAVESVVLVEKRPHSIDASNVIIAQKMPQTSDSVLRRQSQISEDRVRFQKRF